MWTALGATLVSTAGTASMHTHALRRSSPSLQLQHTACPELCCGLDPHTPHPHIHLPMPSCIPPSPKPLHRHRPPTNTHVTAPPTCAPPPTTAPSTRSSASTYRHAPSSPPFAHCTFWMQVGLHSTPPAQRSACMQARKRELGGAGPFRGFVDPEQSDSPALKPSTLRSMFQRPEPWGP